MSVSVVIPLYNKERWVVRAVLSALTQTRAPSEVIVVDDGSTDDGRDAVRSIQDPRIRLIEQENSGPAAARNRGMRESKFPFVAFLDADDEWLPEHLAQTVGLLESYPAVAFCCDAYQDVDTDHAIWLRPVGGEAADLYWLDLPLALGTDSFPINSNGVVVAPRRLPRNCAWFVEEMRWGEDVNAWLRWSIRGAVLYRARRGVRINMEDGDSLMRQSRKKARPAPDYLHGVPLSSYSLHQRLALHLFVLREFMKAGFQNRGSPLEWSEFAGVWRRRALVGLPAYLALRFAPDLLVDYLRRSSRS